MVTIPAKTIIGYTDRFSVAPGETIRFMVSCEDDAVSFRGDIVRLVCGDTSPGGPGYKEHLIDTPVSGAYRARRQDIQAGSYVMVADGPALAAIESFSIQAMIWPTTPHAGQQALIARFCEKTGSGFALVIDRSGALALLLGDGEGQVEEIATGKALKARQWYFVGATYDAKTRNVTVFQEPIAGSPWVDAAAEAGQESSLAAVAQATGPLLIAAWQGHGDGESFRAAGHFNGKIDRPRLAKRALSRSEMMELIEWPAGDELAGAVMAAWDFSRDIGSDRVHDLSPNGLAGKTVNLPARAMTGYNWDGTVMDWRSAPEQYGAIHFHDDDIYDAKWDTDFALTVPDELASGIYAARVRSRSGEDYLPFVVRPRPGAPGARIALLLPTASYMAYGNVHIYRRALGELCSGRLLVLFPADLFLNAHPEYGSSSYDTHSDGSGVCYASRLKPLVNTRPKVRLWNFNADTLITDWLEHGGHAYDVITDEDLHEDGVALLAPYRVVITGTHPEYYSKAMMDAVAAYTDRGGRLIYLGANGFYTRIDYHPDLPGVIEVRRNNESSRTWEADPGEYYHSFSGAYGGAWRRQNRAPQSVAGVGFTAQGFDRSEPYTRKPDSFDPRAEFIFESIGEDEVIGNFGLAGDGAAGLEIDRHDFKLGSPPHSLVVASSVGHTANYLLAVEDVNVNFPNQNGTNNPLVRADMVFYETRGGGAVFATGSIAWAYSLCHNGYDNNVARITGNVLRRFLDDTPFPDFDQSMG